MALVCCLLQHYFLAFDYRSVSIEQICFFICLHPVVETVTRILILVVTFFAHQVSVPFLYKNHFLLIYILYLKKRYQGEQNMLDLFSTHLILVGY